MNRFFVDPSSLSLPYSAPYELTWGHDGDAGYDLRFWPEAGEKSVVRLFEGDIFAFDLGIKVVIPFGMWGYVEFRSKFGETFQSLPSRIIDAPYRGNIWIKAKVLKTVTIAANDKIAQLLVLPLGLIPSIHGAKRLENLDDYPTERGNGGFGSTDALIPKS